MNSPEIRIEEVQKFMQFVVTEWPQRRGEVQHELARRCSRCILSERFTPINDGLCDRCRSADSRPSAAPEPLVANGLEPALRRILNEHAGRGPCGYDALVLFSGGKDSAYLLHRLRTEHHALRLLAVTIDNGFMSRIAVANCKRVLQQMDGVDHLHFTPEVSLFVTTFRYALTHLGNGDCYSIVDRMDGDLTFDIGRNLAARLRVPLVIAGLSPNQVRRILELDAFETRRSEETQRRTTSAGFPLEIIYPIEQRQKYWWDGTAWPKDAVPRVIYPFVAWSYDEDFIRGEVVRLGLIAAGQDNPLATNNDLIPVMLAVDIIRLGYSAFEPEFAELVRANKADRQFWLAMFQALEFLVPRSEFMPQCISETLRRLGLTHGELGIPSGDGKQRSENSVR